MNKREVLAQAKNDLGDCKALAEQLNRALDYAQDHIAELQEEYYLDTPQGIVVSIDLGDNMMASEFLGTVFALCPSGKYYTPWANSNVESCNRCKGTGESKKLYTCPTCQGNGFRFISELAAIRHEPEEITAQFLLKNYPDCNMAMGVFDCIACKGKGKVHNTCDLCNGLGSREAYEDELYYEALDRIANKHGMYIMSGEGDPCDVFVCVSREVGE